MRQHGKRVNWVEEIDMPAVVLVGFTLNDSGKLTPQTVTRLRRIYEMEDSLEKINLLQFGLLPEKIDLITLSNTAVRRVAEET